VVFHARSAREPHGGIRRRALIPQPLSRFDATNAMAARQTLPQPPPYFRFPFGNRRAWPRPQIDSTNAVFAGPGHNPAAVPATGNCGKDATTADLQDLLIHAMKGIAQYAVLARAAGAADPAAGRFILYGMFTTLTNVNFDASQFVSLIHEAAQVRDCARRIHETVAAQRGLAIEVPPAPRPGNRLPIRPACSNRQRQCG
jgi:hypothetical protein